MALTTNTTKRRLQAGKIGLGFGVHHLRTIATPILAAISGHGFEKRLSLLPNAAPRWQPPSGTHRFCSEVCMRIGGRRRIAPLGDSGDSPQNVGWRLHLHNFEALIRPRRTINDPIPLIVWAGDVSTIPQGI